MQWKRLSRVAAVLAAATSLASVSFAQQDPMQKRVDLFLRDADLHSAIQALTLQTGLQFVVQSSTEDFKKIDLKLSQRTAEEAIQYICKAAGAVAERDANGVFIIRAGTKEAAAPTEEPVMAVAQPKIIKHIKVMRGDPEMILSMITKAVAYDSTNGFYQIDRFTKDVTGTNKANSNLFQIYNSGQPTSPMTMPKLSNIGDPGTEAGGSITLPNEAAGQVGGGGGLGGGGLGGGQQGGGPGGQNNGGVGNLQGGQGLVPTGIDRVIYDPTDNSFIVQGSEEAIRELERLIEQFDVQPRQVVIKVEFVATTQTADRALGIDWLYGRGTIFAGVRPGEFARSGDPVFFNYSTGNLSTRLRTLMNNGWGRSVSAPLLRTLNNQPALVAQTITTYIFVPIVNNGPGGQQTFFNPVPVPVSTFLAVKPRINNDNTIAMTLTPNIATITGFSVGPDGQQLPNTTQQQITLSTIVKNGETIALAGFTTKKDSYAVKRIPVLSDLPIVGQLFRGRNDSKESSELVVFVTPNIVQEDELGLQP
ncbi:MAG: hypothetical protein JSS66_11255 [Armatimonadetes bacterium]|nr:hypothetical protein [Armatimonadota bacterium]